jgi:cytochrome c oxidase assembly protein subunit 15
MTTLARIDGVLRSRVVLLWFAAASVLANVVIVVTGGAVRLSDSGLGCPTWPTCQGSSITPTGPSSYHKLIEFTNRTLTTVLVIVAVATVLLAWRQRRELRLALLAFGVIPAQIVIGGISVLTDLNPWVVALHLLVSMANIAVTVVLWWRLADRRRPAPVPRPAALLARATAIVAVAVLMAGTVVTGSGPHSGAKHTSQRIAIKSSSVTQLHADLVMVLIGLSIGLLALLYAVRADGAAKRAVSWLIGIELAQGVIGYAQYFTNLPGVLVGIHMFGACTVWIAAVYAVLSVRSAGRPQASENLADAVDDQSDQRPDDRAVHPDELKIPSDLKF